MPSLIHQVYVISKNGPLLFAREFIKGQSSADPDLSSGLITALYHFTRDTHAEMIHTVAMEDLKLVFDESETLLFATTVDIRLPDRDALEVLHRIRDYWVLHYGEHEEKAVDRSKFLGFGADVERIIVENLWWLGEGRRFSLRNQGRYLRETVSRPSRTVGSQYLSKSYILTPILIILATIGVSFFLGGQVMGFNMQFIETPDLMYLLLMSFNIIAFWLIMSVMTAGFNRKFSTLREVILSSGYGMIFMLGLFFVASRFYVDFIFNFVTPQLVVEWLEPTASQFIDLTYASRLFLLNDPASPIASFVFILWQLPGTILLFAWLVLFAYITYNIQRPKPLRHVLAIALAFVFVTLLQSMVYWYFFESFFLLPSPS